MIELVMAILFFALAIVNATVMILFFLPERKYKACHPDVSVIIPAHNEESTIKSTVESVLSSSYAGNMEIIIVNDGSTDGTAARVPKNKKLRLFNVKHGGKAADENKIKWALNQKLKKFLQILHDLATLILLRNQCNLKCLDGAPRVFHKKPLDCPGSSRYLSPLGGFSDYF